MNPLQALWICNPEELNKLVGFEIETFYKNENQHCHKQEYIFWGKGKGYTLEEEANSFLNGKTKALSAEKLEKKCWNIIRELRAK